MIVRFEGCKGCLASGKQPGKDDMRDWWLHQLHLYVRHDHVLHWKKLYGNSWLSGWDEDIVRELMVRREANAGEELRKLGVEL